MNSGSNWPPTCVASFMVGFRGVEWLNLQSALSLGLKRLGDDADIGDARLFYGVHHGSEGAEGHALVCAQIDDLMRRIVAGLSQFVRQIVNVHRLIAQVHLLI